MRASALNMKFLLFLNLFCIGLNLFNCEKLIYLRTKSSLNLVKAVDKIINKAFLREVAVTNLISPEISDDFLVKDFKDLLLAQRSTSPRVVFRQETTTQLKVIPGRIKRFNVFIIRNYQEFFLMFLELNSNLFKFNGYFLVVLVNGVIPEVGKIFDLLWNIHIYNVIVIFEVENGSVLLQTFMPFQDTNCSDTSPVLISEFNDGNFIKGFDNLYPEKMKNLHRCQIRLSVATNQGPFVFKELLPNGTYVPKGQSISLIETLSERMNFCINYTYFGPEGYFFENGSSEGPLKYLVDGNADLSITNWWLKTDRLKFFDSSTSYASDSINLLVPPGKDITAFEKLFFPFKTSLWILISLCFVVGFLVIFITKRHTKFVQNFVFGNDVKNHYLNLFIGFIGGAQIVLPRRNFARFLLMTFLLYSLVIRTLYQGSFYKFSQSNKHHKRVQSIEEMVKQDFKFYVFSGVEDLFKSTEAIKNRSFHGFEYQMIFC